MSSARCGCRIGKGRARAPVGMCSDSPATCSGDLSLLAGHRDDHHGTVAPEGLSDEEYISWLDELQIEWVQAARRLSPRLVIELLDWAGPKLVEVVGLEDESALSAHVSWASTGPVPAWLDHARELSERWIHRQQILQAIGRPTDLRPDVAERATYLGRREASPLL
jgi:hypothetical protein